MTAADSMGIGERIRGCLLAGAVGDALGAPIEFEPLETILARTDGELVTSMYEDPPRITDDTQMTLFCAEGLLRVEVARATDPHLDPLPIIHAADRRWLRTQRSPRVPGAEGGEGDGSPRGRLLDRAELHATRAPGNTCIGSISSGRIGTPDHPLNDSMGCGGVMRIAPVGILPWGDPFLDGVAVAAMTHGHPNGYVPAGAMAAMVAQLLAGASLPDAVEAGIAEASGRHLGMETAAILRRAVLMAAERPPHPHELEELGKAWVGHEALAIAVCCALATNDPVEAMSRSVTHSGDADSTGAICGNLLGAAHGAGWIPAEWCGPLVEAEVVAEVAEDLATARRCRDESVDLPATLVARYPGA